MFHIAQTFFRKQIKSIMEKEGILVKEAVEEVDPASRVKVWSVRGCSCTEIDHTYIS